jgi:hypothetical protein
MRVVDAMRHNPIDRAAFKRGLPIEHEEGGNRTNVKQCNEHGGVPVNTFNSILKRYVVHTPQNNLCWWTGAARISSVSHSCLMDLVYNLILQAAMLAVSATTHIYVLIDNR